MDRIINYLSCVLGCAVPGIIALGFIFGAMGLVLTALALVGVATLVTIPEIWAIIAAFYGVAVAMVIVACLVSCGFAAAADTGDGGDGGDGGGAVAGIISTANLRLGLVAVGLTLWSNWDRFFS